MRRQLIVDMRIKHLALGGLVVALAGCGGSGTTTTSVAESSVGFGTVSSRAVLTQDPVVVSTGRHTLFGVVGSITDATYRNTAPDLLDTQIAAHDGENLFLIDYDKTYESGPIPIPVNTGGSLSFDRNGLLYFPRVSPNGFARFNQSLRTISSLNALNVVNGTVSGDGTKFAYFGGFGPYTISYANLNGSSPVNLGTNTFLVGAPVFSGANAIIASDGVNLNRYQLTGGTSSVDGTFAIPILDGRYDAVTFPLGSPSRYGLRVSTKVSPFTSREFDPGFAESYAVDPTSQRVMSCAPDGTMVDESIADTDPKQWRTFGPYRSIAWGYLPLTMKYVGSGSPYYGAAAGLLTGMLDGKPRSFLVFDATTRSTARLRNEATNENSDTQVLIAEANAITSLKFSNDRRGYSTSASIPSGTNTIVVAFNRNTGKIMSVITSAVTRSGIKVTREDSKTVRVLVDSGTQYDANGNSKSVQGTVVLTQ